MRVSFVCRGMGEGGGIQRVINEIMTEMLEDSLVEKIIVISDNFPSEYQGNDRILLKKVWTPAKILKHFPRYWLVCICQPIFILLSSLELIRNRKKYGVIYNHGVGQSLIQDVVVFHSCHHEWVDRKRKKKSISSWFSPLDWIILFCEKWNTRKKSHKQITAVSEFTKLQVRKHFKLEEIQVIPNGVNIKRFSCEKNYSLRMNYGLNNDDIVILFVANEWKRKGLEQLAKIVAELKEKNSNLKLLVAGRSLSEICKLLEQRYDLQSTLIYLGEIKEIEQIYSISDIFCLPSQEDAFGLVIAEAMCAGLPVVITDRCGIKNYIRNGINGYVLEYEKLDMQLKETLGTLIENEQLRIEIGANASSTVRLEMSWNTIAHNYVKIVENIEGTYQKKELLKSI